MRWRVAKRRCCSFRRRSCCCCCCCCCTPAAATRPVSSQVAAAVRHPQQRIIISSSTRINANSTAGHQRFDSAPHLLWWVSALSVSQQRARAFQRSLSAPPCSRFRQKHPHNPKNQQTTGTMLFGEFTDPSTADKLLGTCLDAGVNFFDCAEMYPVPQRAETYGRSEEVLGGWLGRQRR